MKNHINQLSEQVATQSSGGSYGNMLDNHRDDEWEKLKMNGKQSRKEDLKEKKEEYTTFNEKTELRIEKSEVKNRHEKEKECNMRIFQFWMKLQFQQFAQMSNKKVFNKNMSPKEYYSNKTNERTETNKVLVEIYALFATMNLKKIWIKNHQYLKVMGFLTQKKGRRMMMYFSYHICLPNRESNDQTQNLKESLNGRKLISKFQLQQFLISINFPLSYIIIQRRMQATNDYSFHYFLLYALMNELSTICFFHISKLYTNEQMNKKNHQTKDDQLGSSLVN